MSTRMKKGISRMAFIFALSVLWSLHTVGTASADDGGYTIRDYNVEAVLKQNNVLEVTEVIQVHFNESRHGIYRNIPTHMYVKRDTSDAPNGEKSRVLHYKNQIKRLSVEDWDYETDYDDDDNYIIRIGDEDTKVDGDQTYRISYRYVMPDDRVQESDFLYYSVLGSGWKTTIDHFSFHVTFEKPLPAEAQSDLRIYSGTYGSEEDELHVMYDLTSTEISGDVYDIAARQAVTIFANLPDGYYKGAYRTPSAPVWIMLAVTVALGLGMLVTEYVKRDQPIVQTIEFYPPEHMSSAEVGTIIDESADDIDMMSLIPWWADGGYITIEEVPDKKGRTGKHGSIRLHRISDLPEDAPKYQRTLFLALFSKDQDVVDLSKLKEKFANKFDNAKSQLRQHFTGDKKLSTGALSAVCLLFLLCTAYTLMVGFSSQVSLSDHLPMGLISGVVLLVFGVVRLALKGRDPLRKAGGWIALSVYGLCSFILAMVMVLVCAGPDNFLPTPVLIGGTCLTMAAIANVAKLIHFSAYKQEMMGKLMGLRQFIKTAELSQLKMLVDENPSYYYGVLPYAMAFGMMDDWAKRFEGLTIREPEWYQCNDYTMFNLLYFNQMMHRHVEKPIHDIKAEAAEAAASSSSSGGGFSGGGAVGGGGGSW